MHPASRQRSSITNQCFNFRSLISIMISAITNRMIEILFIPCIIYT